MFRVLKANWFFLGLAGIVALGTLFPELGRSLKPGINGMVSVSMILIGLRLDVTELRLTEETGKATLLSLFISFCFMPVLSFLLAHLFFPTDFEMFAGVLLAGAVPTTQASSVIWTDLSGGNQSLALSLMIAGNLVGVILCPFILSFFLGSTITVPIWPMLSTLLMYILLPVCLGIGARTMLAAPGNALRSASRVLNILFIWATVLTALSSGDIRQLPLGTVLLAVAAQYGMTACVSYFGALAFGLAKRDAIAVMYCSAQVTITFAAVVGFTYFSPRSIVYVVFYHLFQQFMGQLSARMLQRERGGGTGGEGERVWWGTSRPRDQNPTPHFGSGVKTKTRS